MKPGTERLLQVAAVVALVYFGWNLAVQTVVQLIQNNNQIQVLQTELQSCRAQAQSKTPANP